MATNYVKKANQSLGDHNPSCLNCASLRIHDEDDSQDYCLQGLMLCHSRLKIDKDDKHVGFKDRSSLRE